MRFRLSEVDEWVEGYQGKGFGHTDTKDNLKKS